jgi:hypothetical protein
MHKGCPASVIATQAMRSVGETQGSIQVLVHHHLTTRQRRPPAHPLDLQAQILKAHRVIAVYAAFELQGENPFHITIPGGHKRMAPLPGRDLKTAVELGDVIFPQKPVRRLQRPQLAQPQLLRQAALLLPKLRSLRPRASGE